MCISWFIKVCVKSRKCVKINNHIIKAIYVLLIWGTDLHFIFRKKSHKQLVVLNLSSHMDQMSGEADPRVRSLMQHSFTGLIQYGVRHMVSLWVKSGT